MSSDEVTFYQWDYDPIEAHSPVLALLLESDDGAHQTANYRRIDVTETIRRGGTVVVALGIAGGNELKSEFGNCLRSKYGFEFRPTAASDMRSSIPALEGWFRRHIPHVVFH